jgi:hypothetical protein
VGTECLDARPQAEMRAQGDGLGERQKMEVWGNAHKVTVHSDKRIFIAASTLLVP